MSDKNQPNKPDRKSDLPKDLPARPTDKKTEDNVRGGRYNTSKIAE